MIVLGDLGTWIGSGGTVLAFGAVIVQMHRDRTKTTMLAQREVVANRRSIAEKVSAWPGNNYHDGEDILTPLLLQNNSDEPIYEILVALVFVQGAAPRAIEQWQEIDDWRFMVPISILPPGRWTVDVPGDWGGMYKKPGAEIAFTDTRGVHWVRRSSGALREISCSAFDHFNLIRPLDLRVPEQA